VIVKRMLLLLLLQVHGHVELLAGRSVSASGDFRSSDVSAQLLQLNRPLTVAQ